MNAGENVDVVDWLLNEVIISHEDRRGGGTCYRIRSMFHRERTQPGNRITGADKAYKRIDMSLFTWSERVIHTDEC